MDEQPSLGVRVVRRVAEREGVDPLDLPPLYDAADPDALDALFRGRGSDDAGDVVRFDYHGYSIAVDGSGEIEVTTAVPDPGTVGRSSEGSATD